MQWCGARPGSLLDYYYVIPDGCRLPGGDPRSIYGMQRREGPESRRTRPSSMYCSPFARCHVGPRGDTEYIQACKQRMQPLASCMSSNRQNPRLVLRLQRCGVESGDSRLAIVARTRGISRACRHEWLPRQKLPWNSRAPLVGRRSSVVRHIIPRDKEPAPRATRAGFRPSHT